MKTRFIIILFLEKAFKTLFRDLSNNSNNAKLKIHQQHFMKVALLKKTLE